MATLIGNSRGIIVGAGAAGRCGPGTPLLAAIDDFNRVVPSGFGTASSGVGWTIYNSGGASSLTSVNGSQGVMQYENDDFSASLPISLSYPYTLSFTFTPIFATTYFGPEYHFGTWDPASFSTPAFVNEELVYLTYHGTSGWGLQLSTNTGNSSVTTGSFVITSGVAYVLSFDFTSTTLTATIKQGATVVTTVSRGMTAPAHPDLFALFYPSGHDAAGTDFLYLDQITSP